jgi:hypothetical protein
VSSPKNYSIPDIDWEAEFSASSKPKNRKPVNDQEEYFVDTTGSALTPAGNLLVARSKVGNVYTNSEVDVTQRLPQTGGHKLYVQLEQRYSAVNSVSGAEYIFPVSGSLAITVPDATVVTSSALVDFIGYIVSCLFAKGSTTPDLAADIIQGDLDPTR